ncbi:MAG: hypothetical protein PHT95_02920 [Candidatus Omnitrophica bacterium]|nr:hypothetical protein [Candidatus Omnitrophota bacterium]
MKKIAIVLVFLILVSAACIGLAFLYVDLSIHRTIVYEATLGKMPHGSLTIDRYLTENKVVYKSVSERPYDRSYRQSVERLILEKEGKIPLKYAREEGKGRRASRLTLLCQNFDKTDYLFLEHPRFLTMKSFETGEKTSIITPYSVLTYLGLFERYNFWKKGTQYFEVMIPCKGPVPLMRDKVAIREHEEGFLTVMGKRTAVESYKVVSKGLPEATLTLTKDNHMPVAVEFRDLDPKYMLKSCTEDPAERLRVVLGPLLGTVKNKLHEEWTVSEEVPQERTSLPLVTNTQIEISAEPPPSEELVKEVFFEADGLIVSGKIWAPPGKGPFTGVLFVQKDGPITTFEELLVEALAEKFTDEGYMFFAYSPPGQGKSQGFLAEADDTRRIRTAIAALSHLRNDPRIDRGISVIMGHMGGAYIALKASEAISGYQTCVVAICPSFNYLKAGIDAGRVLEYLYRVLASEGIGPFEAGYMRNVSELMKEQIDTIASSTEKYDYFMGVRLPAGAYREYMDRKPMNAITQAQAPVLLILTKKDVESSPKEIEALKTSLYKNSDGGRLALFNDLDTSVGRLERSEDKFSFFLANDAIKTMLDWIKTQEAKPRSLSGKLNEGAQ